MTDYYWGNFGYPTEDCEVSSLSEISAWAWTGSIGTLNIAQYNFVVGQPDPRNSEHQITDILSVVHSYQTDREPETEIIIVLSGNPGGSSWEMIRPLAYTTSELASESLTSEHPWTGPSQIITHSEPKADES